MLSDLLMYKSEFIFEVQSGGWSTTKFFDCVRFYSLVRDPGIEKLGLISRKRPSTLLVYSTESNSTI